MLSQLAYESGIAEDPSIDENLSDTTIADVLEENHTAIQPTDVLAEVEHDGHVATYLEDLAERADDLVNVDDDYAVEALKMLGSELQTLTRIHKLTYAPTSFESAGVSRKASAIASDARHTANHLRANASALSDMSNESRLLDLFKSKDSRIAAATGLINRDHGRIKQQTRVIEEKGVEVRHNFLARFLTANRESIPDLDRQLDVDLGYIKSWVKYVEDRLDELNRLSNGVELIPISEQSTTTFKGFSEGTISYAQFNDDANYPLLGSQGMGMGSFWDGGQNARKLSTMSVVKNTLGGTVMGGGVMVAGIALGAPMLGIVGAGVTAFLVAKRMNDQTLDSSKEVQVVSVAGLDSIVKKTLAISTLANTDQLYARLDNSTKGNSDDDKDVQNHRNILKHVIQVYLDVIKTHAFYVVTNISMLLELTVKRLKSDQ